LHAVETLTVWVDDRSGNYSNRKLVKAIKVKWDDGKERVTGNQTGISHSFKFDEEEKVTSLVLWAGDRVDRIQLKTDGKRVFDHGGKCGDDFLCQRTMHETQLRTSAVHQQALGSTITGDV
jgi:hypothetical protein